MNKCVSLLHKVYYDFLDQLFCSPRNSAFPSAGLSQQLLLNTEKQASQEMG